MDRAVKGKLRQELARLATKLMTDLDSNSQNRVPARSIVGMHLKPEVQPAFSGGRLLIVSPFEPKHKRVTAALAEARNRFVGALADRIFVAHAAPGSRTMALCEELHAGANRSSPCPIRRIRHDEIRGPFTQTHFEQGPLSRLTDSISSGDRPHIPREGVLSGEIEEMNPCVPSLHVPLKKTVFAIRTSKRPFLAVHVQRGLLSPDALFSPWISKVPVLHDSQ